MTKTTLNAAGTMVSITKDALFYFGAAAYRIIELNDTDMRVVRNSLGIVPGNAHDNFNAADECVRMRRPDVKRTHVDALAAKVDLAIADALKALTA